jgi:hypothetical protein
MDEETLELKYKSNDDPDDAASHLFEIGTFAQVKI